MADVVIHQIENSAKIGALIGIGVTTIIGLVIESVLTEGTVPSELFYALGILGAFYFGIQGMYFVKFIIQKYMYLMESRNTAEIQSIVLDKEMKKLGLKRDILNLELQIQGVNTTEV